MQWLLQFVCLNLVPKDATCCHSNEPRIQPEVMKKAMLLRYKREPKNGEQKNTIKRPLCETILAKM